MLSKNSVKPISILSDNEPAFLTHDFLNMMMKEDIVFNTNALNDHHALGIIDNFAKRKPY